MKSEVFSVRYEDSSPQQWDDENPDYQNYYAYQNYYHANGKPKKKHTGLLVILVVLALITGAASWAVNVLGLRVDIGQEGVVMSFGEKLGSKSETQTQQTTQQAEESTVQQTPQQTKPADPASQTDPEGSLVVNQSPQSVENYPADVENALSLQQIYEKVIPSAVSISCLTRSGTGSGSGIVMSADGYIITNFHVVEDAEQIFVLLEDARSFQAQMVGGDENTDLAVLKIEAADLVPAEFGDSDALRVGDVVVAIGDPLGSELRGTMTDGIVSAINRDLNLNGRQMTLIQTNAALNSGNSGGPLINCYGQVVGINTMKMSNYSSTSATVEGLGFAIPITNAKPIIDELIQQGYVSGRPAIGIQGQNVGIRAQLVYMLPSGVVITHLEESSDAYAKGLRPDDIIVGFNGVKISSLDDLVSAKNDLVAGDTVLLTVYRGGSYYEVEVVLMDQINTELY